MFFVLVVRCGAVPCGAVRLLLSSIADKQILYFKYADNARSERRTGTIVLIAPPGFGRGRVTILSCVFLTGLPKDHV